MRLHIGTRGVAATASRPWTATAALATALLGLALALATAGAAWAGPGAERFPNVELRTQDNQPVRFYDDLLKGKSVAIHVIYTSCTDECPLEMANLVQVQRLLGERMGRDVVFYSISIDPKHDTPAVLKDYAQRFNVGPGWTLLTGKPEDIAQITRKLGLIRNADAAGKDGHMPMLLLGQEATGQWMRHSAVDNPRFLQAHMKNFFGWRGEDAGTQSYADARPLALDAGQMLFQSRCSACHTVNGGQGNGLAPDLLGVTARRDRAWLERYVAAPDKLQAEGDAQAVKLAQQYPKVRMPNLRLSSTEVSTVLDHLAAETAKRPAAAAGGDAAKKVAKEEHHHH